MRRFCLLFVTIAFLVTVPRAAAQPTHDITIDDYFTLAVIQASAISPDGKLVAYSEARWQKSTGDRKSDLWIVDAKTSKSTKLTFDRCNPRNLMWTADSKAIYFLANRKASGEKNPPRDGKTQVWRISPTGEGLRAITEVEGGIEAFAITADGRYVFYVIHDDHVEDEWKALREKFDKIEYGHGINKVSQVWKLDTQTWRSEKVIDATRYIYEIALTPDGKKLVMITAPDDRVVHFEGLSRVDVWDAESKKIATIPDKCYRADAKSPYAWLENVAIAPDGNAVAFNAIWDGYPCEVVLGQQKNSNWQSQFLDRPGLHNPGHGLAPRGYGGPLAFVGKNQLAYIGETSARNWVVLQPDLQKNKAADLVRVVPEVRATYGFSFDATGKKVAIVGSSFGEYQIGSTEFQELYVSEGQGKDCLTKINPQTNAWKLSKVSIETWKGANGDEVQGILELPYDYKPGTKIPLVVDIHGGPTTAYYFERQFAWFSGRTILPARGYAVLCPNYRGSSGYGDKFLTDLLGKENDWDVQDILKGVDFLVEKGIADPDRLAVMGWSNGGYLTNCCITHTDRFKAAISGAGIVDAMMEFGANDEPAYSIVFKRGFPWTAGNTYVKASPSWKLDKIKTPTLIHVGGGDERCPPMHSKTLYRALKEYNKVPTELLVYPGEPHGLRKYANIRAKMEWDEAWLSKYVMGKGK
ncbi:MAG TPA: S9 family peptidase [Gemmataceae bacterium]|nr:S9 family peptidase [Gemmataceae bacterium]